MFSSKPLKGWGIVFAVAGLALAGGLAASEGASLEVQVKYTGPGTVDESHAIYVFVFDTPNIQAGSIPVAYSKVTTNGERAKFAALTASPVYIAATFDEQGGYDPAASGPPPSGSPAALYSADGTGAPSGVELESGKGTQIDFEFGDAFRMP